MNSLERRMTELLLELRARYHAVLVKAEFEDEGSRLDEVLRLKEIAARAGLGLAIKIGGCSAVKELHEARALAARQVIAPMVESPYALAKFVAAVGRVYPADELGEVAFLINVETITACRNFEQMLARPELSELTGIVIGRTDLAGSLGLERAAVDSPPILELALAVAAAAKARGLQVTVGGSVSANSLPFFGAFPHGHLDRIETRKVVFADPLPPGDPALALRLAAEFELLWLRNKRAHYGALPQEDDRRLLRLEALAQQPCAAT